MKKILVYSCLLLWTIWTLSGIIPNANHYSFLDWIIVVIVYALPCSILITFDIVMSKKSQKKNSTSIQDSDSPNEDTYSQQNFEELSNSSYDELDLLHWQNLIYPSTTQLRFDANQLRAQSAFIISKHAQIAHDCMEIINTTTVPETFFSRYDLLIEKLTLLSSLEKYVKFNTYSPTQQLNSAIRKQPLATKAFIDRCWNSTVEKASPLKTEKGRKNRYQKFYDTLLNYSDKMTEDNILYAENIIKSKVEIEGHYK